MTLVSSEIRLSAGSPSVIGSAASQPSPLSRPLSPSASLRGEIDGPLLAETLQEVSLTILHSNDFEMLRSILRPSSQRLDSLAAAGPSSQASRTLKQLQDVCSSLVVLPPSYRLTGIQVNHRRRIGGGGEASIFLGTHGDKVVAVREIYPPDNGEWNSVPGTAKLKVSCRDVL